MTAPSEAPPRRVVITGASGFFGWHLRCRIHALRTADEVRAVDRDAFYNDGALVAALQGADAVVHLAGANRGACQDVYETNIALAERLVTALSEVGDSPPHLVYADSRHREGGTAYGVSKREAAALLDAWAKQSTAVFSDIVFPNLFGEYGRPDYNSAIATFARDLAEGRTSDVDRDGQTVLLHVQAASAVVLQVLKNKQAGRVEVTGTTLAIPDAYQRLRRLATGYDGPLLPDLRDQLDLELFNTLRAALFPRAYPMPLAPRADVRGVFTELVRAHGKGQFSSSTTVPGATRGGHYHFQKVERFVVLQGDGVIRLRRLLSDEVMQFPVSGDRPVAVDMPTLHTHDITNVGSDLMLTAFWANDHFDPKSPDTYVEDVCEWKRLGVAL